MRHFNIDQPQGIRAWPDVFKPVGRPGAEAGARPLAAPGHALRDGLLVAGRFVDAAAVATAGLVVPLLVGGPAVQPLVIAVVTLIAVQLFQLAGLYRGEAGYGGRRAMLLSMIIAVVAVPAAAWGSALLGGTSLERAHSLASGSLDWSGLAWGGLAGALTALCRFSLGMVLRRLARWGKVARRVLVVGDREKALEVLALLAGAERRWAFPVGVCLDRHAPTKPSLGGFIASLADAEAIVHREQVDDIIVALPWSDTGRMAACLAHLRPLTVDVHLFPDHPSPFMDGEGVSVLGGVPMAKLGSRPLSGPRRLVKEAEDRVLGLLLFLLLAPLMAAVAVAIKLDSPGPVLFRQQRYGYDNKPFTCFKFRSMYVRPEEQAVRQATRDDPRVTKVGRFIRRTSLDELPQLLNVLNGTMSLVGPRPHAVSHHHTYARLVDDYRCRHRMKPGVTGWAQVNGYRGETSTVEMMRKRVLHDLWYIDHWSPWLDLKILARTPLACLKGTNAY